MSKVVQRYRIHCFCGGIQFCMFHQGGRIPGYTYSRLPWYVYTFLLRLRLILWPLLGQRYKQSNQISSCTLFRNRFITYHQYQPKICPQLFPLCSFYLWYIIFAFYPMFEHLYSQLLPRNWQCNRHYLYQPLLAYNLRPMVVFLWFQHSRYLWQDYMPFLPLPTDKLCNP